MMEWWNSLNPIIRGFYISAAFFSVFLVWQLIAALIGLAGDHTDGDIDSADGHDFDHDADHDLAHDAHDTTMAFRLLSIRSILAFCTLFSWAGAMYMQTGSSLSMALLYAVLWGGAAMGVVAGFFHVMRRMTESGNLQIASCVGTQGTVYLDIPKDAIGEARVTVDGVVQVLRARSVGGDPLAAGTVITVTRVMGPNTIEVKSETKETTTSTEG
jgi:membrane protein implicated in regulation of membrane protease activity